MLATLDSILSIKSSLAWNSFYTGLVIENYIFICISGYGLPLSKEPNKKGDIVVNFDILFPERLSQNTKDLLHDLLPN